jgi:hypothetical protein
MWLSPSSFNLELALATDFKTFFKGNVNVLVLSLLSCLDNDLLTFLRQIPPPVYLTENSVIEFKLIWTVLVIEADK